MNDQLSIRLLSCIIPGFGNKRHDTNSGCWELHSRLWRKRMEEHLDWVLMFEPWTSKGKEIGDKIAWYWQLSGQPKPVIVIASHSWGCITAKHTIERLADYGISVDHWLIIDGVSRSGILGRWFDKWWLRPSNLIALTKFGHINVPQHKKGVGAGVEQVQMYRQINKRPFGREIRVSGDTKAITPTVFGAANKLLKGHHQGKLVTDPSIGHNQIDDYEPIHKEFMDTINTLLQERKHASNL